MMLRREAVRLRELCLLLRVEQRGNVRRGRDRAGVHLVQVVEVIARGFVIAGLLRVARHAGKGFWIVGIGEQHLFPNRGSQIASPLVLERPCFLKEHAGGVRLSGRKRRAEKEDDQNEQRENPAKSFHAFFHLTHSSPRASNWKRPLRQPWANRART